MVDAGGAGDAQMDGLIAFLPRLAGAALELPSQAIGLSDKTTAIHSGEIGKGDLICASFAGEYLAALVHTRGPRPSELERAHLLRRQRGRACCDGRSEHQHSKHTHRLPLEPVSDRSAPAS